MEGLSGVFFNDAVICWE